jgi:NMD protein affecting ribosome stability and mRNA decay
MYCADCGVDHHAGEREERTAIDREIELARINAKRDVDVARINARVDRDGLETAEAIAEVEAEAAVEAAVVQGEVVAAALEASDVEAEPIEIVAPDIAQNVDVDMSEELPPAEGSPVPAETKKHGLGMW